MRRRKEKTNTNEKFSHYIALGVMVVVLVLLFVRIFNTPPSSSLNEINNITSILEVLVAVLAIMGFELFIQINDSLRRVEKFDERLDKLETVFSDSAILRLREQEYINKEQNLRIEASQANLLRALSLADIYLSRLSESVESEDYHEGMSIVFSKAAEIFKYAEWLFYVYFNDETMEIDERKFNMSISAIEYFEGAADEKSVDTFCELFNLRLREARNRIKTWESLLGSVTDRLKGCVNFSFECEELEKRRDYLQGKIDREKEIFRKVYTSITELGKTPDIDSVM